MLSILSVCCLELMYKSPGFDMLQWSGEAVSSQPERLLGATDGIINKNEEDSEEDAVCLLCGLREPRLSCSVCNAQIASQSMNVSCKSMWACKTNLKSNRCWYITGRTEKSLPTTDNLPVQALKHTYPHWLIESWRNYCTYVSVWSLVSAVFFHGSRKCFFRWDEMRKFWAEIKCVA